MRRLGAVLVSLGCVWAAIGCQKAGLVRNPPAPYFGPRVAGGTLVSAWPAPRARMPVRQVAWDTSLWRPGGPERPWQFIVIHHSATSIGSADEFDRMHRAKGWDELGYHFVIGNGTGSADGEVEIGGRWTKQKHGAHAKIPGHPEFNDVGIGICLVGNFDITRPTEAQMESLAHLTRYLMDRYGISKSHIYGHGQLKPTDCPGRRFDYADFFRRL